ncbi:PLD nuclease N-terminal domain-containing protein [Lacticaseibacillus parakribbianus]|uniref:PLD nuclease N-terminal domain-containing protein n=1 Tax=Lacticaseibacillus parakribbianus TaxID=2970927 RepID=UPI0021CB1C90|nr:PLD nuclease N-terminal domain-containing protein [Lacticaseibacillus parakribbianus]
MTALKDNLPLLLPLVAIDLGLLITALVSILRHHHFRYGNKVIWLIAIFAIHPFGAIAYLLFGREVQ